MRRSADQAARDVEAALNAAAPDLPAEMALSPPQYFKADTSQIPVLLIAMTSTSMPPDKLYDLADTLMRPAVAQIDGVAQAQLIGGAPHAIRISLNNQALTAKSLTSNDVANVLRAANVASPQGIVSDGITQMTVTANDGQLQPAVLDGLKAAGGGHQRVEGNEHAVGRRVLRQRRSECLDPRTIGRGVRVCPLHVVDDLAPRTGS